MPIIRPIPLIMERDERCPEGQKLGAAEGALDGRLVERTTLGAVEAEGVMVGRLDCVTLTVLGTRVALLERGARVALLETVLYDKSKSVAFPVLFDEEGMNDGVLVGVEVGFLDGPVEGVKEGSPEGVPDGVSVGMVVGCCEGCIDGTAEGRSEGSRVGATEGAAVAAAMDCCVGTAEGAGGRPTPRHSTALLPS